MISKHFRGDGAHKGQPGVVVIISGAPVETRSDAVHDARERSAARARDAWRGDHREQPPAGVEVGVQRHDAARPPPPMPSGLSGLARGLAAMGHVETDTSWKTPWVNGRPVRASTNTSPIRREDRHGEEVPKVEGQEIDAGGDLKRAAAHAHVMTAHAYRMNTPEAHRAAAAAHKQVAAMHQARR